MNTTLGRHMLVEFYNCDADTLNDVEGIERVMNQAAEAAGATIVQSTFHRFEPYGVSGVVVISESHLAIHTWPEYRYASVDLYTCGDTVDPMVAYEVLNTSLQAESAEIQSLRRGHMDVILKKLNAVPGVHSVASINGVSPGMMASMLDASHPVQEVPQAVTAQQGGR